MDSEYEITPINSSCNNIINKNLTISSPGSATSYSNQNITNVNNQHDLNSQYDNINNMNIVPLYGGKSNKNNILYTIYFLNKKININANNEKNAIKSFLNNKIYKKDNLLQIIHKNIKSLYIIRSNYKNKFIKIK